MQHKRKTLLMGNFALAIILLVLVAKWFIYPSESPAPLSAEAVPKVDTPSVPTKPTLPVVNSYESMLTHPIFHFSSDANITPEPTNTPPGYHQAAELELLLVGTIAGDPEIARAIIKNLKTGVADHYKTNDLVAGARIAEIERNRVVLVRQKRKYEIHLAEPTQGKDVPLNSKTNTPLPSASHSRGHTDGTPLETILTTAHIEPFKQDGQNIGLRVTNIANLPIAGFIGLQEGDIIRHINGQRVDSKQKGFQVMQKARSQSVIDIDLLRDGVEKQLHFEK
jgi:type II secretion system protein C